MKTTTTAISLFLLLTSLTSATPITRPSEQQPLLAETSHEQPIRIARKLHGRFLHITDIHPDPFYLRNSSASKENACHRGRGRAGLYGAEVSGDCDSPFSLANATFKWIKENLRDEIDFVVWTGDSARHDNDVEHPRTEQQIFDLNRMTVDMMVDTFGKTDNSDDDDPANDLVVPVVPSIGNNDILPHNIFLPGPSSITRTYLNIWRQLIPEAQTHIFERGAYFFTEVIPNRLAVFSLNTMYFFTSNTAVDGCDDPGEPGYAHFEWLKVQLDLIRERKMKAMLIGHVPPAYTPSKQSWDRSCWDKYMKWSHAYRDILVGGLYGHMNLDHFMLLDTKEINKKPSFMKSNLDAAPILDEGFVSVDSAETYLSELRDMFSELPKPPKANNKKARQLDMGKWIDESEDSQKVEVENIVFLASTKKGKKGGKGKKGEDKKKPKQEKKKYLKSIGGKYGERYIPAIVAPSVVPNYFPSLRVMEYNISGLVDANGYALTNALNNEDGSPSFYGPHLEKTTKKQKSEKGKKKHPKTPKKPDPDAPKPPSTVTAPGPAYSPQSLTLTGFTQYYANITYMNGWVPKEPDDDDDDDDDDKSDDKKKEKKKKPKNPPVDLTFKVEYSTMNDGIYKMKDLTVKSYLKLANRIAKGASKDEAMKKPKKGKKDKQAVWHTFVKRAFVGAVADDEIRQM